MQSIVFVCVCVCVCVASERWETLTTNIGARSPSHSRGPVRFGFRCRSLVDAHLTLVGRRSRRVVGDDDAVDIARARRRRDERGAQVGRRVARATRRAQHRRAAAMSSAFRRSSAPSTRRICIACGVWRRARRRSPRVRRNVRRRLTQLVRADVIDSSPLCSPTCARHRRRQTSGETYAYAVGGAAC